MLFSKNKDKKYKLLKNDTIEYEGRTLYRIQALKETLIYKKGELGGYIQSEKNLSHDGSCWVEYNAMVFDEARIEDHALVRDCAMVYDFAIMENHSEIRDNAKLYGDARIEDEVIIRGNAKVYGHARLYGNASVADNAKVFDYAVLSEHAKVYSDAIIEGEAEIRDHVRIADGGHIKSNDDYAYIRGFGCENRETTFYRVKSNKIYVLCGCFSGSLKQFRNQVKERYKIEKCSDEEQVYRKQYLDIASIMEYRFNNHWTR